MSVRKYLVLNKLFYYLLVITYYIPKTKSEKMFFPFNKYNKYQLINVLK